MSKTFQAQILTPEGSLYEGEVEGVQVPGKSGNFLILFNHAPIVSTLGVGPVIIKKSDNTEITYAVSGGFVEINDNHMTLLAEKATESSEIDVEEAKKLREDAKERTKEITKKKSQKKEKQKNKKNNK